MDHFYFPCRISSNYSIVRDILSYYTTSTNYCIFTNYNIWEDDTISSNKGVFSNIAILGFSFKENIGDYRESPTEFLVHELANRGAKVHIVDPYIEEGVLRAYGTPEMTAYEALESADALVLMTAHSDFKDLDLRRIKDVMRTAVIVDGRRIFDPEESTKLGFVYRGIGAINH